MKFKLLCTGMAAVTAFAAEAVSLRDASWMWGHDSGVYDGAGNGFNIPVSEAISMGEATKAMGLKKVTAVTWNTKPTEEYLKQFEGLQEVGWVIDNGNMQLNDTRDNIMPRFLEAAAQRAEKMKNLVWFELDDFFYWPHQPRRLDVTPDGKRVEVLPAAQTLRTVQAARERLKHVNKNAKLRLVVYSRDLVDCEGIRPMVDLVDAVMFWTWQASDIKDLERNFEIYRKNFPDKPTWLGIYLWDFGGKKPIGEEAMAAQLKFALDQFRFGRISGVVFHCTPLANKDKDIPEVKMVKEWLRVNGATPSPGPNTSHTEKLMYNSSGTCPLKGGLSGGPTIFDADGDGDYDLLVSSGACTDRRGQYLFINEENIPGKGAMTFTAKGKVGEGHGVAWTSVSGSGRLVNLSGGQRITYNYRNEPMKRGKFAMLPYATKGRGLDLKVRDLDGDGADDIVFIVDDWTKFGWDNAYNREGVWTNGLVVGYIYFQKNLSGGEIDENTKFARPVMLKTEDGMPMLTNAMGSPAVEDWDGDGDVDIICADFAGALYYWENIGTKTEYKFAMPRMMKNAEGDRFRVRNALPKLISIDWDKDGKIDLIMSGEDCHVGFCRGTGEVKYGVPIFEKVQYLRAQREQVCFGALVTPSVCDLNGDGNLDLVAGESGGFLAFIKCLGRDEKGFPRWDEPKLIQVEGKDFFIKAGYNGSIQGPVEEGFGYTVPWVVDWDLDGLQDIILNTIRGDVLFMKNIGTKTEYKFAAPVGIEVEWNGKQPEQKFGWYRPELTTTGNEKNLITQWRTTPCVYDLNEDGLPDLVMLDVEGYLAFFERFRKQDGSLGLKAPVRSIVNSAMRPYQLKGGIGGQSGRRKICFADWDNDGKVDLILNSAFTQWCKGKGTKDGKYIFDFQQDDNCGDLKLQGHTEAPCRYDVNNDGKDDLIIGCEDGFFYYILNPKTGK